MCPLLLDLARAGRRRNAGAIGAGGGDGVTVRANEHLQRRMRGPSHRDPAFRSAQCLRNALLATREHERERSWPVPSCEVRGKARELEVELREHLAAGDEEQEWLPLG